MYLHIMNIYIYISSLCAGIPSRRLGTRVIGGDILVRNSAPPKHALVWKRYIWVVVCWY